MRRIKTVVAKGRSFKITVKIKSETKYLTRYEAEKVIYHLADKVMNDLEGTPYFSINLSKIKVT